jgi:hypothetical protein
MGRGARRCCRRWRPRSATAACLDRGAGPQGDRCLREDHAFEVGRRSELDPAGHLPEDVRRQAAAAEDDLDGAAHRQVLGDLENPDALCVTGQSHVRGKQQAGAPFVDARGNRAAVTGDLGVSPAAAFGIATTDDPELAYPCLDFWGRRDGLSMELPGLEQLHSAAGASACRPRPDGSGQWRPHLSLLSSHQPRHSSPGASPQSELIGEERPRVPPAMEAASASPSL